MYFLFVFLFLGKVVNQFYQTRVIDEFVLKGNAAILKCLLPSFVADFVSIDAWILDETVEINSSIEDNNLGIFLHSKLFKLSPNYPRTLLLLLHLKIFGIKWDKN